MRRFAVTVAFAVLAIGAPGLATPAGAEPAQHEFLSEEYDASEPFAAGEGFCVEWAGTFHEVRSGGYDLVMAPGGQADDEVHVNGVIDGMVELIPDNPNLPTYSGSYREKVNAIVSGYDEESGDLTRIGQYRLRLTLTGTDGSRLVGVLAGKMTINANGDLAVARETFSCSPIHRPGQ